MKLVAMWSGILLAVTTLALAEDPASQPATTPATIAFTTHDGYFVSNKFEPEKPESYVVLKDQKSFDAVFSVAMVDALPDMADKSHRLPADAFDTRMVVAAIRRGKATWQFKVKDIMAEGGVLTVRYTTTSEKSDSAEFACPLIVSVPKGQYTAVVFEEGGKVMTTVQKPDAALRVEALKNAEYRSEFLGEGKARLVNGVHVEKESPNSATETRVTLSDLMATGDLNGDGVPDAAVVLVINTGGTGCFHELAAVVNQKGEPNHIASASLGDRVQIKQIAIKDGQITVRMVTHGPNDPMSTPTLEVTQRYKLDGGKLVPVKMTPPTEKSLNERYEQIYAACQPVRSDFANGRYNGKLPLEEVVTKLEQAKKELAEVKAAYDRLDASQKTDQQIAMRFLALGKMGFAALDAEIKMVRDQTTKQKEPGQP